MSSPLGVPGSCSASSEGDGENGMSVSSAKGSRCVVEAAAAAATAAEFGLGFLLGLRRPVAPGQSAAHARAAARSRIAAVSVA